MNKLYVGSFGTLAILTEVILKLRPLPERSATMVICSSRLPHLFTLAYQLLRSGLQPVSASLASDRLFRAVGGTGNALFIRFMESDTLVKFQSEKAARMVAEALGESGSFWIVQDEQEGSIWRTIADMDRFAANAFKLSVPVSRIPVAFELCLSHSPGCIVSADPATGVLRIAFDAEDDETIRIAKSLREAVRHLGGFLFVEKASTAVRKSAGAWGAAGPATGLMTALKSSFDPQSLLNPGRFVAGI
jgi:glycolate oxidase FAD binding subunit